MTRLTLRRCIALETRLYRSSAKARAFLRPGSDSWTRIEEPGGPKRGRSRSSPSPTTEPSKTARDSHWISGQQRNMTTMLAPGVVTDWKDRCPVCAHLNNSRVCFLHTKIDFQLSSDYTRGYYQTNLRGCRRRLSFYGGRVHDNSHIYYSGRAVADRSFRLSEAVVWILGWYSLTSVQSLCLIIFRLYCFSFVCLFVKVPGTDLWIIRAFKRWNRVVPALHRQLSKEPNSY